MHNSSQTVKQIVYYYIMSVLFSPLSWYILLPAVAKEDCRHTAHSEVCGIDGKTYPTLCHLQQSGVMLAYSGHCRPRLCGGMVCGRDGVTYPSSCHAKSHNVRVDYTGHCFAEE